MLLIVIITIIYYTTLIKHTNLNQYYNKHTLLNTWGNSKGHAHPMPQAGLVTNARARVSLHSLGHFGCQVHDVVQKISYHNLLFNFMYKLNFTIIATCLHYTFTCWYTFNMYHPFNVHELLQQLVSHLLSATTLNILILKFNVGRIHFDNLYTNFL